jgi:hypothetical protein
MLLPGTEPQLSISQADHYTDCATLIATEVNEVCKLSARKTLITKAREDRDMERRNTLESPFEVPQFKV